MMPARRLCSFAYAVFAETAESLDALDEQLGISRKVEVVTNKARGDIAALVGLGLMEIG